MLGARVGLRVCACVCLGAAFEHQVSDAQVRGEESFAKHSISSLRPNPKAKQCKLKGLRGGRLRL